MKYQRGFTLVEGFSLIGIILILAGAVGWVWNIVKIVDADFAVLTGMVVLRCIGIIIAPLGAILGYF